MNAFQLKDRVCLTEDNNRTGMIVKLMSRGRYKVLWDRDWNTGRTYVYNINQLTRLG